MDTPIVPQKCCSKCKQEFPATTEYFYASHGKLDSACKSCRCLKQHERHSNNREVLNQQSQKRHAANRERDNARNREYLIEHPEVKRRAEKNYRRNHPDRCVESNKRWLQKQPNKRREYDQRRRIRESDARGSFTAKDVEILLRSQKDLCWWCGKQLAGKYHVDHRIPLSRGGSNNPENLCISCASCNHSKSDKLPSEWSDRLL